MTKTISKVLLSASIAAIGLTGVATNALAQLDELIVTAERRAESLQTVPIAVTAFSSTQLMEMQIYEAIDLIARVPNLVGANNVGQSSNVGYFMRGVGNDESIISFDPPVQSYIDDVLIPRQLNNNISFLDVERVEILRGPQGQLHGRNTTGGAVKVFTVKPSGDTYARGSVYYGNYDEISVFGTVNGALSDNFYAKITGFWEEDDGFQKNIVTGDRSADKGRWGVRGQLRYETDDLTIDLSVDHSDLNEMPAIGAFFPIGAGPDSGSLIKTKLVTTPASTLPGFGTDGHETGVNLTINWDLGPIAIESITAYRDGEYKLLNEFLDPGAPGNDILAAAFPAFAGLAFTPPLDILPLAIPNGVFLLDQVSKIKTFSQELKGTASFDIGGRNMDWVGGLFYINERNDQMINDIFALFGATLDTPGVTRDYDFGIDSYAVYSQFDYNITDSLSLIFGFRVTHEKKTIDFVNFNIDVDPDTPGDQSLTYTNADVEALGTDTTLKQTEFDPKVGLEWQVNDDAMVYFTAANSFKPGGWSTRVDIPEDLVNYSPEGAWSYEVGAKTEWFDNRLRANIALFWVKYSNLVTSAVPVDAGVGAGSVFSLFNAGDAVVRGVELELFATPTDGLDLFASVGFQEGDIEPLAGLDLTNTAIKLKPDWTVNFGGNYKWPVANLGYAFIGANAYWHSDYFQSQTSFAISKDKMLANANIGFETEDEMFRIQAECSNCFDRTNIQWQLFNRFYPGEPLRYGIRVSMKLQ